MAIPVVIVESGGLPVSVGPDGYGVPMVEADNGIGIAVTIVEEGGGGGLSVSGISSVLPGAPANTVAPVISGTATIGQTLSCTTGTWSNTPTSYAYRWRRNGTLITGATASTYVLVAADNAAAMTCRVIATNATGASAPAYSNTLTLSDVTPVNSVAPVISGTLNPSSVLSATTGTWSNTPSSYTYQWTRAGSAISGATASTYTLVAADQSSAIVCQVTAVKLGVTSPAATSNTLTPGSWVPANTVAPVISGTAEVGALLSATTGTWTYSPASYAYAWYRDGVAISGATSATYTTVALDEDTAVTCRVTATNTYGTSTAATSNILTISGAGETIVTAANGQWWRLAGTLENGLYVDGSPWVKTATTVSVTEVSSMPTGSGVTARHGGMINPTFNTMVEGHPIPGATFSTTMKHGYDGRIDVTHTNPCEYSDAYNDHSFPLTLSPGDSLVSAESFYPATDWDGLKVASGHTSNVRVIKKMACLTCVSTTPAADAFRPNYYGTTKANWTVSDLNLALLPDYAGSPFSPKGTDTDDWHIDTPSIVWTGSSPYSYMTGAEYMRVQGLYDLQYWVTPYTGEGVQALQPNFNQDFHATSYGDFYGRLATYVCCDFADRDTFVKHIVQYAIDAYAIATGFTGRSPFGRGAGFFSSPLWFIRFAGLLFDDTSMKNVMDITCGTGKVDYLGDPMERWGENQICYYSEDAHAQYLGINEGPWSGAAYPLGFPLYGDQAHQSVPASSTGTGSISSNCSLRDPDGVFDSGNYQIGLPHANYPDSLDDAYEVWQVSNPGEWGTYYMGHHCGIGVVLASIMMDDFAWWRTGNRAYGDWIMRRTNDPQMWGYYGVQFDYSDWEDVGDPGILYWTDIQGFGGAGNGWMVQMWNLINPPAVAPTVSSFSPLDNATGVAITDNLTVTFDMNVQFGTGNITLYKTDDTLVEAFDVATEVGTGAGQVSIAGAVLTINPTASLLNSTGYYVQIAATAIESTDDIAFAGILDETTWSFTTVAGSAAAWTQVWTRNLAGANPGWNGYTLVYVIPLAKLSLPGGGTQIRLSIKGASADGTVMSALWVGNGGGGDPYDFTGDQVQLLQSGGTTITAGTSATITTDGVNFVKDGTNSLVIAWQHTSGTGDDIATVASDGTSAYWAAVTQASLQNKSGYNTAGGPVAIAKVELFTLDYVEESGAVETISEGASTATGFTYIDRTWTIDNNMTITKIGFASPSGGSCKVKIAKRVSAGTYDIVASETFTHPGGGYKLKTLTTPYVVPSTGDYYVAFYDLEGAGTGWERWTAARAHYSGDATGTGVAFTESTSNAPLTRAVGTR